MKKKKNPKLVKGGENHMLENIRLEAVCWEVQADSQARRLVR